MSTDFSTLSGELAPKVPLIPASVSIKTEKIHFGWWTWRIHIQEETYGNKRILPWNPNSSHNRRIYDINLDCSEAFDPVPDLHWFIRSILCYGDSDDVKEWEVDEEGRLTTFKVWTLSYRLLHLQIKAFWDHPYYEYNLIVDRDELIDTLMKTYCDFGKQGGWGLYGDKVFEEDWFEDPEFILDAGAGKTIELKFE